MATELRVPFADLRRAALAEREELADALLRVLDSGWFVLGDEGRAFEAEFAAAIGARRAVGVASGTDAIEVALRGLGVGPGDDVVTQANTCVPTVAAIERAGATPVLCDVDPESGVMTAETLEPALSERTRAVVVVHLYGQAADMPALMELCDARGVTVVEDCAQAHGARVAGRPAGTFGAAGCFSFYPTKNLGALGDGGAVVTADDELAGRLARLRTYGQADRYRHVEHGVNSRLDELQAAVLRARLPRVAAGNARRREIADRYTAALDGTPVVPLRRLPDREHAFHLFVVRAPDRDGFQAALRADGIDTLVHYPEPIHGHPPYRALGQGVSLAHAERLAVEVVSLPLYPELSDAEVAHVAARARAAAQRS